MGYSAWSVIAGEQPTASKWNLLGSNDSSFNDGTGIGTNAVAAASLATSAITLGFVSTTANFTTASTTAVQVTSMTLTVTIPSGSRRILVMAGSDAIYNTSTGTVTTGIWDGTVGSGTKLGGCAAQITTANQTFPWCVVANAGALTAGSKTYNLSLHASANTAGIQALSTSPCWMIVVAV